MCRGGAGQELVKMRSVDVYSSNCKFKMKSSRNTTKLRRVAREREKETEREREREHKKDATCHDMFRRVAVGRVTNERTVHTDSQGYVAGVESSVCVALYH